MSCCFCRLKKVLVINTINSQLHFCCLQKPKSSKDLLQELFQRYSGNDGVIDAKELQLILNSAFATGKL